MVNMKEGLTAKDYQSAIDVQNGCNLSGIVFSFSRVMQRICNVSCVEGHGTEWKNTHAIARLYAEQIMFLTSGRDYSDAADECEAKAKEAL